ncbi:DUF3019 domain-containing protein [Agaribacterium sp. ZY112]|uniref:DUF3019 domain-containing protein n=1 Tax=Agaribacterium sp. ZY112 TaxID=3233574 RepID=UPI0035266ACF
MKLVASEFESVSLELNPQRCIALHRGQRCYQDILFRWKSTRTGHFCLFMRQGGLADEKSLKCWQKQAAAEFHYEFSGEQSSWFFLVDMETKEELASTELDLVWVYKRSKKISSGWRLF